MKYLPSDAPRTLLDYGAGGGGFLAHASLHGWKSQGFEPGKRGLETCRQAGLDVTDRTETLCPGRFGLVTMNHVFEHLANPIEVLGVVRKLLAHEGRLYIEVPNERSLRSMLAMPFLSRNFRVDERHRAYPIHLMYYSDRTLRRMLRKAGWTVQKTFTIGIGLDEFVVRTQRDQEWESRPIESDRIRSSSWRFRHLLRDAFLGLGLGENLAVIATPDLSWGLA